MSITVEFYGIARLRTGVPQANVVGGNLEEVLHALAETFPDFARECLIAATDSHAVKLQPQFVASLGGDRFVSDSATPLADGATLLILSADAGG